ncbi:MAG: glycerol-3-phosphate dehydrogenase/oxidase [Oligoflexia bacterium]|nr:glycerol-3-phosphate dehydrogenase/oxidase [Oligoflexia bacterium]
MQRFIENYDGEHFDVIIIGGGITGASVAYEAASKGMSVALVEKRDFSCATSAATSKLIHGGLRYLANGELKLVRESLKERRVLENIAPNFVYPMPILMVHDNYVLKNNKWLVKLGMLLYDLLSYDKGNTWDASKRIPNHQTLSRDSVLTLEPKLKADWPTGASVFYDCTNICPERLTLAFIKSAVAAGAKVANYTKVEDFIFDKKGSIIGVKVRELLQQREHELRGSITINCTGAWADAILELAHPKQHNHHLHRSEGIHIITKKNLISGKHIIGAVTSKGRHFFMIPWRNHTIIGTTDKPYNGEPDNHCITKTAILELLEEVNSTVGEGTICFEDVQYAYGGLRPLIEDKTKKTYNSSRKYEIYDNSKDGIAGLITVEGGKYTTSRQLAEDCLRLVEKKLHRPYTQTITDKRYLYGCEIKDLNNFLHSQINNSEWQHFSSNTKEYLARHYGTEMDAVLKIAKENPPLLAQALNADGEILAQAVYAVRHEMALGLEDVLFRRTGIATLGDPGNEVLQKVAEVVARELNWDHAKMVQEIAHATTCLKIPY